MRGFLVLIGLLVAVLVAFVVAWPRLVDERALRAELARVLHATGGPELTIDGAVRLELLPYPRIAIDRAVLGDRVEAGPGARFTADRIDIELAPLALLAGRIEARGLQLVRPHLVLAGAPGRLVASLLRGLTRGELADIGRLGIVDGILQREIEGGIEWPPMIETIDLRATRDKAGPFRVDASAAIERDPVRLTLEGQPLALDEPVSLKALMEVGPRASPATLEFDGRVEVRTDGSSVAGTARVQAQRGRLPPWLMPTGLGVSRLAFDLQVALAASPARLELSDLELALNGGRLRGALSIDWTPTPALDVTLDGTGLAATPELVDAAGSLVHAARGQARMGGRIDLRLATVAWRGEQVRRVRAELALVPGAGLDLRQLEAVLPGETALTWAGDGPSSPEAPLRGRVTLQAGELRRLLRWLGAAEADLPPGGLTSLDVTASAEIDPERLRLSELRARLDATQLAGSLDLTVEPRLRLDLALAADRVNTALYAAALPGLAAWREYLAAIDGSLDLAVERLSHDVLRGQGFRLRAGLDAGRLDLTELRLADLGGAGLDLRGTVDLPLGAYDLSGELDVPEPKPILRLLRIEPPLEIDRLAPLRLSGESRREAGSTSVDLRLAASGASASLAGRLDDPHDSGALDLAATVSAAEAGDLLLALGWPAPAERPTLGPLGARLEATRADGPIQLALRAGAAGSRLDGAMVLTLEAPRPRLTGELRAPLLDTGLVAALYDTLARPLSFPAGSPFLWPGGWPRQPLGWDWLRAADLDLALDVAALRHRGQVLGALGAEVALEDGRLSLSSVRAPTAGGTLEGSAGIEDAGGYARLNGDVRLTGARAETLAALLAPGSGLRGRVDLAAKIAGAGRSVADLVGSLDGNGTLALSEARLPQVDLDSRAPTDSAASPVLEGAALAGSLVIADGVATSDEAGLGLALPGRSGEVTFRLDLLAWVLDAAIEARGVALRFLGPPGRLRQVPAEP